MTRSIGDVGHGGRPGEGQQVVLAEGVEGDVLDDHHLAVVDLEDGVTQAGRRGPCA